MKLTHIALVMALSLLGLTTWLAWDARNDARGAHNQLELVQQQKGGASDPAMMREKENQVLMQQMAGKKGAQTPSDAPSIPAPPAKNPVVGGGSKINMSHTGAAALDATPPRLSQRQRMVMSVPAIGKVKECFIEHGFVIITAGTSQMIESGMTFALRRGPGIIGRIKITEVDKADAVGSIEKNSVPAGVAIETGDDVIQDLPPGV